MRRIPFLLTALVGLAIFSCSKTKNEEKMISTISKEAFGQLPDGQQADLYTLTNANGMTVNITNYGGIITKLTAPDKNGQWADVVLGFDSLAPYLSGHPFFGALVGRYGNRIAKGKFKLNGQEYSLAINNGPNALHGGTKGFDKVIWKATEIKQDSVVGLQLEYTSKDMEEGYPGNLTVKVVYTLDNENALTIDYTATTDKPTVVNLTNHSYFNLTGLKRDILDHEVTIASDSIVPVDTTLIPTGKLRAVEGTPFDFRKATKVGAGIDKVEDEQIKAGGGYDHCWVLKRSGDGLEKFATVKDPESGRVMEVYTTEPGVQFYTGNFLDGKLTGKGATFSKRFGLCLETEHYPDSPNQPQFPTTTLNPGETYKTTTKYKFSAQ
ncbi:aldose 1-epimerase [Dyadobacter sp. BE34]|uniref:Aldose 1-epimerase n=1 Tax=Dyadobacter fermentans TaxID=94254 RepID=A0ABU1R0Q8_9BACT|nr:MULTISPECIES: aldose epimerase family protein [Dyadobacter]MDR6806991.1 aldose 1-epimerase [Dyadobacter fermentans]MDR7044732.1 aldose 1-epimerase [Dyadobacter sp. BE242]MDR7199532.1 aldose 1-epimerase [Dyadobacter sp. BE34]MDR7217492.1 aldose 1-epimerase [Dyadobacter sp. BE31]MDR7265424.1 aldose 1-epimerase [Dyadobacter sp. BE32]